MEDGDRECCPRFDPTPWDGAVIEWKEKLFIKDRVRCLFHIPLNFPGVMKRCMTAIEAAGVVDPARLVVTQERSLWSSDVYVSVLKEVPGAQMARISGSFISKVFEGPFSNMGRWVREMRDYVKKRGGKTDDFLFYYRTCPICAKQYGKNHVVILARQ